MLLPLLARRLISQGTLEIEHADGRRTVAGDGKAPHFAIRLHDPKLDWKLAFNAKLRVPEAYMDGTLTLEKGGDLRDFLEFIARNLRRAETESRKHPLTRWLMRFVRQHNPMGKAQQNVAHHYDLSAELYDLFLDRDRQYSCAYFTGADDRSRAGAARQEAPHRVQAAARPRGQRVLDIGSGWGGLACTSPARRVPTSPASPCRSSSTR